MLYLFYLNGEYEDLSFLEIISLLETYSLQFEVIEKKSQTLLMKIEDAPFEIFSRLSLSHRVMLFMASFSPGKGELSKDTIRSKMNDGSFSVRIRKLDKGINAMQEEIRLSKQILSHLPVKVDLENPEQEVYGLFVDGRVFLGKTIFKVSAKDFKKRKPQYRPYFHPSSIDPRIARALVNISQSKREVLDPFCGTGGILIEAGLMGLDVYGVDIEEKMVSGTKDNLKFYGLCGDILKGDATNLKSIFSRKFEAIVTDVPYGKSTVVNGRRERLYELAFGQIHALCEKRAIIVIPLEYDFSVHGFNVIDHIIIKVHRSLERHIYVLEIG